MKQFKVHISSLKGIACVLVMLGHYLGLVKYATSISFGKEFFDFLNRIHMGFLVNESFWLQLFFVISGYLCAYSVVRNFREFIGKSLCRFLRLAIPIFFANLVILILYDIVGFHNSDTIAFFENSWFQGVYHSELSVGLLLRSPIDTLLFSSCPFNSVYWVLRDMFFASLCIYLILLVKTKIKSSMIHGLINIGALCVSYMFSNIVFACVFGSLLASYEEWINRYIDYRKKMVIFALCCIFYIIVPNTCVAILFFATCVVFIPEMKYINKILQGKVFSSLGKISFGIYVFHWPILCSVGAMLVLVLWEPWGGVVAFLVAMMISVVATLLFAIVYNLTAEKWSARIVNWVKHKFEINDSIKYNI